MATMPYLRIDFDLDDLDPERVETICRAHGAASLTFVDRDDDPVWEPAPGEFRLWRHTRVQALFGDGDLPPPDAAVLLPALAQQLQLPVARLQAQPIADRLWAREWLQDFPARGFGRRLWIVPTEHDPPPEAKIVVRLDPGLAFGTGAHPTTAMCLRWLDAHVRPGCSVIDFGCGSGVLAIAALQLGAARAAVFDIDPQALLATVENAERNGVRERLDVATDAADLPRQADLVVANILAQPLIDAAPLLAPRVAPAGRLALAGLFVEHIPSVGAAYADWLTLIVAEQQPPWCLLEGQRARDPAK
ncbi:MAG: 50S ribosomal protein L11 methyltransferase [Steroidobacteraceae bacterium]|nr:50S ribosomal protein L11 methyltransferase [Steroidobacteraceae bacterium]MDW8259581.1 50S ribosomal protein L11 methyltransferase [Gammaproteobacteria bacterium]